MKTYRFLELVEKEKGFEYYQAFRDEIDWVMPPRASRARYGASWSLGPGFPLPADTAPA